MSDKMAFMITVQEKYIYKAIIPRLFMHQIKFTTPGSYKYSNSAITFYITPSRTRLLVIAELGNFKTIGWRSFIIKEACPF
jgi:hypothetical protein